MGLPVVIGFLLLLIVLVIGAGVMLFDLTGRREDDAEWLQARSATNCVETPAHRAFRFLPWFTRRSARVWQ